MIGQTLGHYKILAQIGEGGMPYIAPEVLRGQKGDHLSDLWALGVLLYELAAGNLPFRGSTGFEVTSAILREPTPRCLLPFFRGSHQCSYY